MQSNAPEQHLAHRRHIALLAASTAETAAPQCNGNQTIIHEWFLSLLYVFIISLFHELHEALNEIPTEFKHSVSMSSLAVTTCYIRLLSYVGLSNR